MIENRISFRMMGHALLSVFVGFLFSNTTCKREACVMNSLDTFACKLIGIVHVVVVVVVVVSMLLFQCCLDVVTNNS